MSVVRCEECIHAERCDQIVKTWDKLWKDWTPHTVEFCSYGERKDGDGNGTL